MAGISTLVNDISNSLMVGFNSSNPTLYIGPTASGQKCGKIGIGTTSPLHEVDVNGNIMLSKSTSSLLFAGDSKGTWGEWGIEYQNSGLNFWKPYGSTNEGNYYLFLSDRGYIGVGTDTPEKELDVVGNINSSENISVHGSFLLLGDSDIATKGEVSKAAINEWGINYQDDGMNFYKPVESSNPADNLLFISDLGNVGIGTSQPSEMLDVNGTISVTGFKMNQGSAAPGYVLTTDGNGNGYWDENQDLWFSGQGEDVYREFGNVGIGTSQPSEMLDVNGTISVMGFKMNQGSAAPGYVLTTDGNGNGYWDENQDLWFNGQGEDVYREFGNVGIGTTTPSTQLHVAGNIRIENNIEGARTSYQPLKIYANTSESNGSFISLGSTFNEDGTIKLVAKGTDGCIEFHNNTRQIMAIKEDNHVYLGDANNPSNMYVNGDVNAHLVRVATDAWSDHVFSSEYELRPLEDVKCYIEQNNHLPGIPSETEVIEQGINLGEMDALLLEKIEELTLYMIELKEENNILKEEIRVLKNGK
ncbi:MAG: hypothetical protein PHU97_10710 [Bacteroidales bacterium]|nr:hypothetical protein [Bacteroidales bacterium]